MSWKRQEFKVARVTPHGTEEMSVKGYVKWPFGIDRRDGIWGRPWVLNHLPTGGTHPMLYFSRLADAKRAAERLYEVSPRDWEKGSFGTLRGFGAAVKRLSPITHGVLKDMGHDYKWLKR